MSSNKVKDLAYSRIEKAKQAGKSKTSKTTPNAEKPGQSSSQSDKQTYESNKSDETRETPQPTSPASDVSPAIKKAEGSNETKEGAVKDNKMDDDTVFVSDPPVRAFSLSEPIGKSISESESTSNASDTVFASTAASTSADDKLDEDLAKLDRITKSTSSIASDDFDHLTDRQFSAEDEGDGHEMVTSRDGDTGQRSASTLPDESSSSISSSLVEVATPSSVRDAMFAMDAMFASSTFEEVERIDQEEVENKQEQKGNVVILSSDEEDGVTRDLRSSSGDEEDEKPLAEFRVDDEGSALELEGKGSGDFFRTYWCSILFSPFIIGSFVSIVTRSLMGKHNNR